MSAEKTYIQQTIHYLLYDHAFLGNLLQELDIRIDNRVGTAALCFNKLDGKFEILINEPFFKSLTLEERKGVFFHELLHFTHGHIFRFEKMGDDKQQALRNIAADMAINQFIKVLPKGCVNNKDWKDQTGKVFPDFQTTELYYDLLEKTTHPPETGNGDEKENADGEGQGNGKTKSKNGEKNAKEQVGNQANWDKYKKYKPFDEHDWEQMSEEEKQRLLQEAKRVVTRTIDKQYKDYSLAPDSIKDILQQINAQINKLDYKGLLRMAFKKTLTIQSRTNTYRRPNKRYGVFAPGSTYDKAPFINIYIDTSGSISHTELNEFLSVTDGFLKNAAKKCNLGLWHTSLYSLKTYKLNHKFDSNGVESGGTDPGCVLKHIEETRPNLSIILTDGCYGKSNINLTQKIIWVISKGGSVDHPHNDYGKTVKMV